MMLEGDGDAEMRSKDWYELEHAIHTQPPISYSPKPLRSYASKLATTLLTSHTFRTC
jgi:hypothetical protein